MLSKTSSVLYLLMLCFEASKAFVITSPTSTTTWDICAPIRVEWSAASTDPEKIDLQISNSDSNIYPEGITKVVKQDINSSDGYVTLDLSGDNDLKSGTGYTINFIKSQSDEILAQSQSFSLTNAQSNLKSDPNTTDNDPSKSNKTAHSRYSNPMNYHHTSNASSPVFNSTGIHSDAKNSAHNSIGTLQPSFSNLKTSWVLIVSIFLSVLVI